MYTTLIVDFEKVGHEADSLTAQANREEPHGMDTAIVGIPLSGQGNREGGYCGSPGSRIILL